MIMKSRVSTRLPWERVQSEKRRGPRLALKNHELAGEGAPSVDTEGGWMDRKEETQKAGLT